jgi:hypothetical protein
LAAFDRVCGAVEAAVIERCLAEDTPQQTMGPDASGMLTRGIPFVTRMVRAAMRFSAGAILDDQMAWGKDRLPAFGVSTVMVLKNLERYHAALKERLPPAAFAEIGPWLDGMIEQQRGIAATGQ